MSNQFFCSVARGSVSADDDDDDDDENDGNVCLIKIVGAWEPPSRSEIEEKVLLSFYGELFDFMSKCVSGFCMIHLSP